MNKVPGTWRNWHVLYLWVPYLWYWIWSQNFYIYETGVTTHNPEALEFPATMTNLRSGKYFLSPHFGCLNVMSVLECNTFVSLYFLNPFLKQYAQTCQVCLVAGVNSLFAWSAICRESLELTVEWIRMLHKNLFTYFKVSGFEKKESNHNRSVR